MSLFTEATDSMTVESTLLLWQFYVKQIDSVEISDRSTSDNQLSLIVNKLCFLEPTTERGRVIIIPNDQTSG